MLTLCEWEGSVKEEPVRMVLLISSVTCDCNWDSLSCVTPLLLPPLLTRNRARRIRERRIRDDSLPPAALRPRALYRVSYKSSSVKYSIAEGS